MRRHSSSTTQSILFLLYFVWICFIEYVYFCRQNTPLFILFICLSYCKMSSSLISNSDRTRCNVRAMCAYNKLLFFKVQYRFLSSKEILFLLFVIFSYCLFAVVLNKTFFVFERGFMSVFTYYYLVLFIYNWRENGKSHVSGIIY